MKPLVLFLVGPTAAGKSKLAIQLAKKINGEIVSADSMQVYRGMDIGTAKPTLRERRAVPHHLIDMIPHTRSFSVYEYREKALAKIREITEHGRLPIVVGGTGLYIRALIHGLSPQPGSNARLRKQLEVQAGKNLGKLYNRLQRLDPKRAKAICPQDAKRIVRAMEILEKSGRKPSEWYQKSGLSLKSLGFETWIIGITKDRSALYQDIEKRVDSMFRKGLVKEVKGLAQKHFSKTAAQAVGYKEVLSALRGEIDLKQAKALIKKNTRHLAKRQWTWFKREAGIRWVGLSQEGGEAEILSLLPKKVRI